MIARILAAFVVLVLAAPAVAQNQPESQAAKPSAEAPPKPEKVPAIPELQALRIQNAILKANAEQARYEKAIRDLADGLKKEIADFEAINPGWTIDAQKIVAVKKPAK